MASLSYRDDSRQGAGGLSDDDDKPLPLDFTHHYSDTTKSRNASKIKAIYKFFQIPGILNIAGGMYSIMSLLVIIVILNCTARSPQCPVLPLRHLGGTGSQT